MQNRNRADRIRVSNIVFPVIEFITAIRFRLKSDFRTELVRASVIVFKANNFTITPAIRPYNNIERSQLIFSKELQVAFIRRGNIPLPFATEIGRLVPAGKYHVFVFYRHFKEIAISLAL